MFKVFILFIWWQFFWSILFPLYLPIILDQHCCLSVSKIVITFFFFLNSNLFCLNFQKSNNAILSAYLLIIPYEGFSRKKKTMYDQIAHLFITPNGSWFAIRHRVSWVVLKCCRGIINDASECMKKQRFELGRKI